VLRRYFFSLLLSFGLLVSQQGALLHELGHSLHHAPSNSQSQTTDTQSPDGASHADKFGELCHSCLAFAQIAFALSSAVFAIHVERPPQHVLVAAAILSTGPQALWVFNRGPPTFL
jgi:hypothetical protein